MYAMLIGLDIIIMPYKSMGFSLYKFYSVNILYICVHLNKVWRTLRTTIFASNFIHRNRKQKKTEWNRRLDLLMYSHHISLKRKAVVVFLSEEKEEKEYTQKTTTEKYLRYDDING